MDRLDQKEGIFPLESLDYEIDWIVGRQRNLVGRKNILLVRTQLNQGLIVIKLSLDTLIDVD